MTSFALLLKPCCLASWKACKPTVFTVGCVQIRRKYVLIANFMIENPGSECENMISGKSTHKKCIERLWWDKYNGLYHDRFSVMKCEEILDPFIEIDLVALRYA